MEKKFLGSEIGKLGFGLMRLPMNGKDIDLEQTKKMVDSFIEKGFTYFDTAYVYIGGESEVAMREAIVKRYPRESVQLATKLPVWMIQNDGDMDKLLATSLERTGAGYFDFYLLHALEEDRVALLDKHDVWGWAQEKKKQGILKHVGFSFHDSAAVLDDILTKHPEMEFVQLQINYADWEDKDVQSRLCYEVALKHNKPIVIMEPVKGGNLAGMPEAIQDLMKAARPELSVASWAVRFAASLENVVTVLSGMSNIEQMEDNLSYMSAFEPVSEKERAVIDTVVKKLAEVPTIPCTDCKYCVDGCPQKIKIPDLFKTYNTFLMYQNLESSKGHYRWVTSENPKASACIACGDCETQCPQHIPIIENLKQVAGVFE